MAAQPPLLSHILETCIYVHDVQASAKFYQDALNLNPFIESPRVTGFSLGSTTLLLFELGQTTHDVNSPGGVIPCHGPSQKVLSLLRQSDGDNDERPSLRQHFCVAVQSSDEVALWEEHLQAKGIPILSRMTWERGGKSIYFKDLDGSIVEIGSRGIWPHY